MAHVTHFLGALQLSYQRTKVPKEKSHVLYNILKETHNPFSPRHPYSDDLISLWTSWLLTRKSYLKKCTKLSRLSSPQALPLPVPFSHKRHQAPFRWGPNKAGSGLPMIMASRLDSSFNPLPPQPTQAIHHSVGVASNNKARRWKSEDLKSWWDKWYQTWLVIYSRMCHFPCLTSFWKNLCSLTTQIHLRPQNTFNTFTRQIFSSSNFQHPLAVSPHLFSRAAPCSSCSCKCFCYHQRDPPKQSCLLNNPHQSFATGGHHTDLRNIHEVARFARFSMCFPSGLGILRSIPNLGCHRCLEWQCACHLLLNLWSSVKAHESWDLK